MKRFFIISGVLVALIPMVGFAAAPTLPYWGPLLSCTGNYATGAGNGPTGPVTKLCVDFCDMVATTQNIIYFAVTLVLFVFAPIFLILGGFLILISGGSSERLSMGKKMLLKVVIGIVITLGAFVIINTFLWLLGNPTGVKWPEIPCSVPAVSR